MKKLKLRELYSTSGAKDKEDRRRGFQVGSAVALELNLLHMDDPTPGDKWLAENAPREKQRKQEWPDFGYHGATRSEWYIGESAGFTVVMLDQSALYPVEPPREGPVMYSTPFIERRGDFAAVDRQIVGMVRDGVPVADMARVLQKTMAFVTDRIMVIAKAKKLQREATKGDI